jgi:hypothetical protein
MECGLLGRERPNKASREKFAAKSMNDTQIVKGPFRMVKSNKRL